MGCQSRIDREPRGNYDDEPLDGDVAELVIYDRYLSISEQTEMYTYLSEKYGI